MKQKEIIVISIITLLIGFTGIFVWYSIYNQRNENISNYDECAAAGYPILESHPEQCSVPNGKTYTRVITKETSISLEGITVCLPHKNMDGPHTMECAMGIKADNGKYYGLSSDPYDSSLSTTDRRIHITGTLKTNPDSKYNSEGTITVTAHEFLD